MKTRLVTDLKRKLLIISIFCIAMGLLEAAVVVYLRALYYPNGFDFPLKPIAPTIAITEILREAATIIMLFCIGYIAGRNIATRFAWFIFSFAIWDIFYYVFLKVLLNWPESFFTNDVLFLIPVTWVGPVIAPLLVTILMIGLASIILYFDSRKLQISIERNYWLMFILGSVILIIAFSWDYSVYILKQFDIWSLINLPDNNDLLKYSSNYIPSKFNWLLFSAGYLLVLSTILLLLRKLQHNLKSQI